MRESVNKKQNLYQTKNFLTVKMIGVTSGVKSASCGCAVFVDVVPIACRGKEVSED